MKKRVAILGSTGSIGTQALEVIDINKELFEVEVLTANNNVDLLIKQAEKYQPNVVVISNETKYNQLKEALSKYPIKVYAGNESLVQVVKMDSIDLVLTALVGYAGLLPTYEAIKSKKTIALANKETLVVAGELITHLAQEYQVDILPVDSEHSAIFQCLVGEYMNPLEKIILTCSGGPFWQKSDEELADISVKQALNHPNWDMGAKITIDSATLMNKGFEMIEAHWLFGLPPSKIDVVIHPQSIIHSLVQFEDGSIKAQMGLPDMKLPIQYALGFPHRLKNNFERFDFTKYPTLNFHSPDSKKFRNLTLAYQALERGGNTPCIINAANEIAVDGFLKEKIKFLQISKVIEKTMNSVDFIEKPTLNDLIETNCEARAIAKEFLKKEV